MAPDRAEEDIREEEEDVRIPKIPTTEDGEGVEAVVHVEDAHVHELLEVSQLVDDERHFGPEFVEDVRVVQPFWD